jgi:hypothetical protein
MTKAIAFILISYLPAAAFAAPINCVGILKDKSLVKVILSADENNLAVNYNGGTKIYKIVRTTSRTGDVDRTFYMEDSRVHLTLDDQYGDFLSVRQSRVKLECVGR